MQWVVGWQAAFSFNKSLDGAQPWARTRLKISQAVDQESTLQSILQRRERRTAAILLSLWSLHAQWSSCSLVRVSQHRQKMLFRNVRAGVHLWRQRIIYRRMCRKRALKAVIRGRLTLLGRAFDTWFTTRQSRYLRSLDRRWNSHAASLIFRAKRLRVLNRWSAACKRLRYTKIVDWKVQRSARFAARTLARSACLLWAGWLWGKRCRYRTAIRMGYR